MKETLVVIPERAFAGLVVFLVLFGLTLWSWMAGRLGGEAPLPPVTSFAAMLSSGVLTLTAAVALLDAARGRR